MAQKSQLLDLIEAGYGQIKYFAGMVPVEERLSSGTPDNWQAKDLLAHLVEWQLQTAAEMTGSRRLDPDISPGKNDDERNAIIFEKYRATPWDEIMRLLDVSHNQLVEQIRALSEQDLNQPGRFAQTEGRPLWRKVVSDGYLHPVGHLNPEFIRRGDRQHALQSQQEQSSLTLDLDPSDEWQGTVLYNLACGWALLGEPRQALEQLEQGLRLRPELIEWSKQDSDLASLHGTPEYASLVQQASKT